jgi:hypothetical protein
MNTPALVFGSLVGLLIAAVVVAMVDDLLVNRFSRTWLQELFTWIRHRLGVVNPVERAEKELEEEIERRAALLVKRHAVFGAAAREMAFQQYREEMKAAEP